MNPNVAELFAFDIKREEARRLAFWAGGLAMHDKIAQSCRFVQIAAIAYALTLILPGALIAVINLIAMF